jgi:peptidoglycan/LPS O-acetylase OafA/YrhL
MNAHFRQPLPNRRFRRLLPAALATAALATAGFAGPAKADTHHRPPRAKPAPAVTVSATTTTRAPRVQPRSVS